MDWLQIAGAVFLTWLVLVFLFTPHINYHLSRRTSVHAEDFLYTLQSTCQAALHQGNLVTIYTDGPEFYPAMIDAIRNATRSVNMECYIFQPGRIADQFIEALSDRARKGVNVTIVVDAIGSFNLWGRPVRAAARGRAAGSSPYQRLRWYSLARLNNRTHRELLIVDGRIAFAGGAGIADWWAFPKGRRPPWRDTMAQFEGPIVAALQGVIAENWLECCGEILTGPEYFPEPRQSRRYHGVRDQELAVGPRHRLTRDVSAADGGSGPRGADQHAVLPARPGTAPRARRECTARRDGLGDRAGPKNRSALGAARQPPDVGRTARGGRADLRVPRHDDPRQVMIVDGLWAVLGTTNIDNRSFEHNDEVNVGLRDAAVAARLMEDYQRDLRQCEQITLQRWRQRPRWEKIVGPFVWILERQQ